MVHTGRRRSLRTAVEGGYRAVRRTKEVAAEMAATSGKRFGSPNGDENGDENGD
jgi:hypothetical protein